MGGVLEQRPGDGQALALAARQQPAPLADHRVVALGQRGDEIVGLGGPGAASMIFSSGTPSSP